MQIRHFFASFSLFFLLLTGCEVNVDVEQSSFMSVYPGAVIYSSAYDTQRFTTDGISVGARMLILLEELAGSDVAQADELGSVSYEGVEYPKRELLFGDEATTIVYDEITQSYTITYGVEVVVDPDAIESGDQSTPPDDGDDYSGGVVDINSRIGAYRIATNGVADFEQTTELTPWQLSVEGERMEFKANMVECTKMDVTMWYSDDEGGYTINFDSVSEMSTGSVKSTWQMRGRVCFEATQLTIEQTMASDTAIEIYSDYDETTLSGGVSITALSMLYRTDEPLLYNPQQNGLYAISGVESVVAFSLNTSLYPSPSVVVTTTDGERSYYYNGYTY